MEVEPRGAATPAVEDQGREGYREANPEVGG